MRYLVRFLPAAALLAACADAPMEPAPLPSDAAVLLSRAAAAQDQGDFLLALSLADSSQAAAPGRAAPLLLEAGIHLDMGSYGAADSLYEAALTLEPAFPGAWLNRGNVAFTQRRFRTAHDYYRREVLNEARVWHARGSALEQLGAVDSARSAYDRALALDPGFAPARKNLAEFLERSGDVELALEQARGAYVSDSSDAGVRMLRGRLEARYGDASEGVRLLGETLREQPWNYSARFALGQALQRMADPRAERVLREADSLRAAAQPVERLEMNARDFPTVENLVRYAEALRQAGRLDASLQAYQQAVALAPENFRLASNLATLYLQSGRTEEGLARYHGIVQQHPEAVEAWLNLALHYGRSGDLDRARTYLEGAERQAPDHPTVAQLRTLLPREPR